MKKYQREINEQLNKAQRHVNNCEGAVMFVIEQNKGKYSTVKKEPEQYLFKVTYLNGKIDVASQKHIETEKENKPTKKTKSLAFDVQDASDEATH